MAKIISVGIQKGGSAKTTTAGIISYLLSQRGYRVLAVDMDSQGNLTEMLTGVDIYEFQEETILEAIKERNPKKYTHVISETLHLIPSTDLLATFANYLYNLRGRGINLNHELSDTLDQVKDEYDFIIIDTPPALGEQTINSLCASDYVITMFDTSKFGYSALDRFFQTLSHIKEKQNPKIKIAGILRTLVDNRRTDNKTYMKLVEEEYKDVVFKTSITRTAVVGRIPLMGFVNNTELTTAISQYEEVVEELLGRVK